MPYYDDDGNEPNPDLVSKPSLCVGCMNDDTEDEHERICTNAVGEDLGLVGAAIETFAMASDFKPVIKAKVFPGYVETSFTRLGVVEGVNVYTRLKGQTAWQMLAFDSSSPYIDNRPLATPGTPEAREYSAIGVRDDSDIGLRNDIVEVRRSEGFLWKGGFGG